MNGAHSFLPRISWAGGIGLVCLATVGQAQTNSDVSYLKWFDVPPPQLRLADSKPAGSEPSIDQIHLALPMVSATPKLTPDPIASSFSLSQDPLNAAISERELRRGLIAPQMERHDLFSRGFAAVFKPEEVRFGRRATFSCTVWTAIKRKDPLCLLNPIFLHISW